MRIGVLTGGGDCPGLNAAIRAIAHRAWMRGDEVYGIREGWAGLLGEGSGQPLTSEDVAGILHLGGTILGSSRTNPGRSEDEMRQVEDNLRRRAIDALVTIGGDDTLSVSAKLSDRGFAVVGVPKTIDNDVAHTDYCIGFESAAEIVGEALDRLHTTAESHRRVMVVEVMGRDAGWLAMAGGVGGGADLIIIPEEPVTLDRVVRHVQHRMEQRRFSIVVVAEGAAVEGTEPPRRRRTSRPVRSRAARDARYRHAPRGGDRAAHWHRGARYRPGSRPARRLTVDVRPRVGDQRIGAAAVDFIHEGLTGVMAASQGLEVVPVPFADIIGHNRTVDRRFFRLVRQFALAEASEPLLE